MYKLNLGKFEKVRLIFYSEHAVSDKFHWGDGDMVIPEEENLIDQIKNGSGEIELSPTQLRILVIWFIDATGNGAVLMDADEYILNQIIILLNEHYQAIGEDHELKSQQICDKIDYASKIFGKDNPIQADKKFTENNITE